MNIKALGLAKGVFGAVIGQRRPKTACFVILCLSIMTLFVTSICAAETLTASWYSCDSLRAEGTWKNGKEQRCADGSIFSDSNLTCASWDYPLESLLIVTTLLCDEKNGKRYDRVYNNAKSVVVLVTDRTARKFKGKRIDLSKRAFQILSGGRLDKGLLPVCVERLK